MKLSTKLPLTIWFNIILVFCVNEKMGNDLNTFTFTVPLPTLSYWSLKVIVEEIVSPLCIGEPLISTVKLDYHYYQPLYLMKYMKLN